MSVEQFLAIDLGAESGRAMLGSLAGGKLSLEELHRFPNAPVRLPTGLYWDMLRLFFEIRHSLEICGRRRGVELKGIGIDTWGVDFALMGSDGALCDNPRHYRDSRNQGMLERTFAVVPREEIFDQTGVQLMIINTLYQLYAMKLASSPALAVADKLLFIPDLLNYWLTGVARAELTIASTSQFYDPRNKSWATDLFARLGLPTAILPSIITPGTLLGPLLPEIGERSGFSASVPVYATACHDTASAVAAVPASGERTWCYISSGTWSLLGAEIDSPILTRRALELNFTNEMGAGGKVRLLKNIAGLWLLQECRRAWALEGNEYSYAELAAMAEAAPPSRIRIDPDAFSSPGNMPGQIANFCRERGLSAPQGMGPTCRMIIESLAESYRQVLASLDELLGHPIEVVHIVGGGSRNRLLNQLTADFSGKTVIAGPTEATAAGNILVQALGAGSVSGLPQIRDIVRNSFELETFSPRSVPPR